MIDNLALAISHGLLLLTAWRLLRRADLDREQPATDRMHKPQGQSAQSRFRRRFGA